MSGNGQRKKKKRLKGKKKSNGKWVFFLKADQRG